MYFDNSIQVTLVHSSSEREAAEAVPIETRKMGGRKIGQAMQAEMDLLLQSSKRSGQATLISAPPGAGKTYFLVNQLFPAATARELTVLFVSSRVAINLQQKRALAKAIGQEELLNNLTAQGLQQQEQIGNVTIVTYQRLFQMFRDPERAAKLASVDLFVFDEVHALLHDATFVPYTDAIRRRVPEVFANAGRIYLSATPQSTTAELGRFLQAIEGEPFRNIFFVDIFSGLRISEILGLRWNDVDFENGCIYVRQQLMQNQERGDFSYFLAAPKEGKQRKVILANAVLDAIHKQHIHQLKQRMAAGELWDNSFDLVFTNNFGRPLNRRTVYKHLKCVLRDCGMGDYTFHSLRHSFATISLENGDDIKTVQTNLGHYAASFTLKTYVHVSDQMQRNSAARMQELIASLPRAK